MSGVSEWTGDIHEGDAVETLSELPESSVHMAMCSPPYYGLRDYDVEGQIGLEDTLHGYIRSIVRVGDQLQRVLRDDGNWWLNLGDTFAGGGGAAGKPDDWDDLHDDENYPSDPPARNADFRRKQKMLVPHRVAIALQDAGWIVRADCPWVKPNPMPHPVEDRLHEHKEFIFHLTPEPDYWFDLDSVREPHKECSIQRSSREDNRHDHSALQSVANEETLDPDQFVHPNGKNPGDVFEIPVHPFPDAHFAVYPPELCETPIKSSCPSEVCVECGSPRKRQTEEIPLEDLDSEEIDRDQRRRALEIATESDLGKEHFEALRAVGITDAPYGQEQVWTGRNRDEVERLAGRAITVLGSYAREFTVTKTVTSGWAFPCDCETDETEPGIVLDPFAGAGTTCLVAKRLGRRFVGVDLNPEYVAIAQQRVGVSVDNPQHLRDEGELGLETFTRAVGGEST